MSTQSNRKFLSLRDSTILVIVALLVDLTIMSIQPVPGYMDAAYYYATGIQLAKGNGFNEPIVWNYLDHPQSLPHPSHSYWYPLASLIGAFGMVLTGKLDFPSARIGFLIVAVLFPLAVANLAWRLSARRGLALVSGFLSIFCGYYLPFILTTDNYAVYILIGSVYFLLLERVNYFRAFCLGLLVGLLNLARADGLLWLPLTFIAVTILSYKNNGKESPLRRILPSSMIGLSAIGGYLMVMGPWMFRNFSMFGSVTPPGSGYVLWMTDYNQIFSFTPEIYSYTSWIASGWREILSARLTALGQNLGTAFMAQGSVFLLPLVAIGGWKNRKLPVVKFTFTGWLILLLAESFIFPFASIRGGFFHAGAAFQPLWFVLAPLGLDALIYLFFRKKGTLQFKWLFHFLLVAIMIALSGMLVKIRVLDSGWNEGEYRYLQAEEILVADGISPQTVVITSNPPAYNAMTGRQAIIIPTGDVDTLLLAADLFKAKYLILEENRLLDPIMDIYLHPENHPEFIDIGGFDDVRIFVIETSE